MKADRQETLRYLRMGRVTPTVALTARLDVVERAVLAVARPVSCHRLFPVSGWSAAGVTVGPLAFRSADLARTLAGCDRAFLFCATLGAGVDALMRRYAQTSAADQLLAQAVATALIEDHCDACTTALREEPDVRGCALRPRFSPGYGDLPLAAQRDLLACVDAERRTGVTLTEALLMTPSKSVSAIIGVEGVGTI